MAVPDWVTDLPGVPYMVLHEDWSIQEAFSYSLATDISPAGALRMRNLATQDNTLDNVKIHIGVDANLYAFLDWVRNSLGRGSGTFTMPVYYKGAWQTKRCQIVGGGSGISRHIAGWRDGGFTWMIQFRRRVEDLYTNA